MSKYEIEITDEDILFENLSTGQLFFYGGKLWSKYNVTAGADMKHQNDVGYFGSLCSFLNEDSKTRERFPMKGEDCHIVKRVKITKKTKE